MDLGLYMGVLRRHRLLVASGLAIAFALALLSYVRVSPDGLAYRNPEIWSNTATLQLTDANRPEFRSELPPTAQPDRFTTLVDQYVALATSDAVIRSLRKQGLLKRAGDKTATAAGIAAAGLPSPLNGAPTPLMTLSGSGATPAEATRLTLRATDTFIAVSRAHQVAAKIPMNQRVEIAIVKRYTVPVLSGPRSKTTLIIILLAGITATIAAAFVRDNVQRAKAQSQSEPVSVLDPPVREVEAPPSDRAEPMRAAEPGSRPGTPGADGGGEATSVTHSRWSQRRSG
jgi:hypothetical protein